MCMYIYALMYICGKCIAFKEKALPALASQRKNKPQPVSISIQFYNLLQLSETYLYSDQWTALSCSVYAVAFVFFFSFYGFYFLRLFGTAQLSFGACVDV